VTCFSRIRLSSPGFKHYRGRSGHSLRIRGSQTSGTAIQSDQAPGATMM
jgi:hypothetical protein